ncbi:hypothetical protein BASA60_008179 [Batrachochytrium salamandrivorans]|nr:hypothetical protein BASA60_008179 [Batrachochytrium salamandrivorans]
MAAQSEYLSAFEAERLVESIVKLDISEFGSPKWERQHEIVEKLNIQAHCNLKANNEEYVTQALIVSGKISNLVHNLLITNMWKKNALPHLIEHISAHDSLKAYFMVFSEASLANLIQVLLFDREACKQVGENMVHLVDYLVGKVIYLCTLSNVNQPTPKSVSEYNSITEREWNQRNLSDMDFSIAISALASLRYITDTVDSLGLSILNRILLKQDMCLFKARPRLVVLLERAPWMRKVETQGGCIQRYQDGQWKKIKNDDINLLGQVEAQVWLSLYNLMMDRECRRIYTYTKHNQRIVLRLKDFMDEILMDQLSILSDLKRYLEELTMMEVPEASTMPTFSGIEVIPDAVAEVLDWKEYAMIQKQTLFGQSTSQTRQASLERLARVYDFDDLDILAEQPMCNKCGNPATQRCSKCRSEWYCSRQCQVKAWKGHKSICDVLHTAGSGSSRPYSSSSGLPRLAQQRIQEA